MACLGVALTVESGSESSEVSKLRQAKTIESQVRRGYHPRRVAGHITGSRNL
jgi:hypothetical protein